MYPQMVYHADERAREMELAAAERDMRCSCSPLGRMISRVITKCSGREGRVRNHERLDYAMAYAPAQICYVRPAARTVTFASSDNHHPGNARVHDVQPEPLRPHAVPPPQGAGKPRKSKKKKRVRFSPSGPMPADAPPPAQDASAHHHAAATSASSGGAGAASVYYHGAAEPSYSTVAPPVHGQGGHGYAYGYGRYAPSPLPRWEMLGTPKRHEYFSGEYRWYYPTPVREGIYSIATDANRLTAIFSEENPNACTIV